MIESFSVFVILCVLSIMHGVNSATFDCIYVEFGSNLGDHVINQLRGHLSKTGDKVLDFHQSNFNKEGLNNSLVLSFGNAPLSSALIGADDLNSLSAESFVVRSQYDTQYANARGDHLTRYILAANGLPLSDNLGRNSSLDREMIHYGAILGSYNILEMLGYAWMHPLAPMAPARMQLQDKVASRVTCGNTAGSSSSCVGGLEITESPRWPHRAFHLHTQ
mgnify:CR=1 FL=1